MLGDPIKVENVRELYKLTLDLGLDRSDLSETGPALIFPGVLHLLEDVGLDQKLNLSPEPGVFYILKIIKAQSEKEGNPANNVFVFEVREFKYKAKHDVLRGGVASQE